MAYLPEATDRLSPYPGVPAGSMSARPSVGERRLAALNACLSGQVELMSTEVTLPIRGRRYVVHLPTEAARDRLFAMAKDDPRLPLPHWARVWASGVALADAAFARRDELVGRQVLELGSGLGVTAAAVLEVGGKLLASDYSPLSLAFCRYNALWNTGRGPRTLCFNWRAPDSQALIRAEAFRGFPVIMAGDVLYESGDIEPLLTLVDRLLAPDGTLWLAEPGRKTADRFLNVAASIGWHGVSERLDGPWPAGNAGIVNLHFLHRPDGVDRLTSNLGGWHS